MRRATPLLALLLTAATLPALAPAAPAASGAVADIWAPVGDEAAHGLAGFPDGEPTALVLILHGYTHQAESHRGHLQALADRGALAVAMDYRGPVDGFPLANGAADSCAAFRIYAELHPNVTRILYSVSMGTAVAALVFQQCPMFDWWVNNEGLSMLHETWAGAALVAPSGNAFAARAKQAIEEECGGTPAQQPACYAARSAALHADRLDACGAAADGFCRPLQGAYLTHGLNDGIVPYNQGREMVAALRASGIPADFYTAARGNAGGEGTTITGYAGFQVDGLAGHGSESKDAHALTALSFGLLYDLVEGRLAPPADRELVVDRDAGTLP